MRTFRLCVYCPPSWTLCVLHGSFRLPLVEVALVVEVAEEDDEGDAVSKHHYVHGIGEVALCE